MKKLLMLTTGGTIASVMTEQGLSPLGSEEILRHLGRPLSFQLDVQELFSMDSSNVQPEEWQLIARETFLRAAAYDGIVITHGTDTMAYTASMLTFMLPSPRIPIVLTGSQLPISVAHTDAVSNLDTAFAMAQSGHPGVFLAFDRKIILGCRAVKVRTTSFAAFESVNYPLVGKIDAKGMILDTGVLPQFTGDPALKTGLDPDVCLLKLTPNMNPQFFDALLDSGCHGIVLEAFGIGGIQFIRRNLVEKLQRAAAMGIPVVVCSQCLYEGSDFSVYQVGQKALQTGVIEAGDMTTEAALTKLIWALGQSNALADIRRLFRQNLAGEIHTSHSL